ncbi:chemotaxis protein CheA [Clostridium weizhouense]|uniref:Chemotaxis protein CheA n=1 Tax=Clostridium weizhouense TaxID=2859781 RepID=A0ABS7ALV4_9CLOT|nr:chemotaxis protein CheA [Clostridium weizhouense]MBW6409627.1 chemotaxis protein CheA [Clostridium weizhouense]
MNRKEPMLEAFIFETFDMIEQLEQLIIDSEKHKKLNSDAINEIFRIMHTIKGSSGMMMLDNISHISHSIEELFYFIREFNPEHIDYSKLTDLVLEGSDLIKTEIEKINNYQETDFDFNLFINKVNKFLESLRLENSDSNHSENKMIDKSAREKVENPKYYLNNKKNTDKFNFFYATLFFEDICQMENLRCFGVIHELKKFAEILYFDPKDIDENNETCEVIRSEGFKIFLKSTSSIEKIREFFMKTIFLSKVDIKEFQTENEFYQEVKHADNEKKELTNNSVMNNDVINNDKKNENVKIKSVYKQNLISVDVNKLDILMDLVGELVISEAMVTKNPEILGLQLDSFNKAARQHRKRILDLQDAVMSIRMVPLALTLNKMTRLVRDMCKKLNKEVELEIVGQETEVDKNIIEHIVDPLIHIIRNSMDHGIESPKERIASSKEAKGKIIIEAKNTGGEVFIDIKDDGRGLNKNKILKKAQENGLLADIGTDITDKQIYSLIFLPGFSTTNDVTEFSGRGVGMDVVVKEIEKIRGTVTVDSIEGQGTTISIKIPLTLAIIDGMTMKVGSSAFTIPVKSIRQSFIIKKEDVIKDLNNKEMILVRGESYSILRLHELYNIKTDVVNIENGIVIMVEDQGITRCIFADSLIGQQQVVIKPLPDYIKNVKGISGCSLLGDATISLVLDMSKIINL